MPRKRSSKSEARTTVIKVLVNKREHEVMSERAKGVGLSLSAWLRAQGLGK